ncbi:hypothetical protein MtrunA17_Chr8g0371831 [Medicago truncatula]|uniref:Transmembrane protein n=1 Tax=Medicago truncatula TaxID=3880 RepID=A0A396GT73_MEDTR|nr:hypothetical protein MtrunA17_Chr8g0371831 [Medicago truncatula]
MGWFFWSVQTGSDAEPVRPGDIKRGRAGFHSFFFFLLSLLLFLDPAREVAGGGSGAVTGKLSRRRHRAGVKNVVVESLVVFVRVLWLEDYYVMLCRLWL